MPNNYQRVKISDVINHFVDGYEIEGEEIIYHEYWVDQDKGEIIINLVTEEKP